MKMMPNVTKEQDSRKRLIHLAVLFLPFVLIAPSFFSPFAFDEFRAPLLYLWGRFTPALGYFEQQVLDYKATIPLIRLLAKFRFLEEPAFLTSILYVVSGLTAALGLHRMLCGFEMRGLVAALLAPAFLITAPLGYLSYAYHYKVGAAGPGFGLLAFACMTWLLSLALERRWVAQIFGIAVLYAIHPLNALLYCGLALFIEAGFVRNEGFRNRSARGFWMTGGATLALTYIAWASFAAGVKSSDPQVLASLVRLINGEGESGAYFIPWRNLPRLAKEFIFHASVAFATIWAVRNKMLPRTWFRFYSAALIYVLGVCVVHFLFDRPGGERMLALDPSRMVALMRPLGFVGIFGILAYRWRNGEKESALLGGALFFAHASLSVSLFPLVIATVLWTNSRNFRWVCMGWAVIALGLFLVRGWGFEPYMILRAALGLSLILAAFGKADLFKRAPAFICVIFFVGLTARDAIARSFEYSERTQAGHDLQNYFSREGRPADLVLTPDERFTVSNGIQGSLVAFHNASYGIYLGGMEQLSRELESVWQVHLDPEWVSARNQEYAKRGGFSTFLEDRFAALTAADLERIRKFAPALRYVLAPAGIELKNLSSLPLREVLRNRLYTLWELTREPGL
jgi:hypothetical protein